MKNFLKIAQTGFAIVMIIALVFTACTKKGEASLEATQQQTENNYAKILNGDFSAYAGTWVNGDGERVQLKANGMWGNDGIRVFGFKKIGDGANAKYSWNVLIVENDEMFGDIYTVLDLFPSGVDNDIEGEYLVNNSLTRGIFPTDNTKDRIVRTASIMSDSPFISSSVYYREGEYPPADQPQTIDFHGKILEGDLSAFEGAWVTAKGARMYLNPDGTSGGHERAAGYILNDYGYYQWNVSFADAGGYGVELYPPGIEVRGIKGQTDATKDRLFFITSGDAVYNPDQFYYRAEELPAAAASAANAVSDDLVLGTWVFKSGGFVFFFGQSPLIEFKSDKTVNIYEQGDQSLRIARYGIWGFTPESKLFVAYEWNTYLFSFGSDMETLTITDSDGNSAVFFKSHG